MSDAPPYGLTDAELEELNQFFVSHPGPYQFGLDAAHGLLSAVVAAPEPIAASEWLPLLIEEDSAFNDGDEANRVLALIVRLYNSVVQELEAFTYQPIYSEIETEDGSARLSPKGWCEGFAAGIDLRSEIWSKRLGSDPRLIEIMDPIIRLSAEEGVLDIDVVEEAAREPSSDTDAPLPGEMPLGESDDDDEGEVAATEEAGNDQEQAAHDLSGILEPMSEPDYDAALNAVAASVADIQQYWRENQPGQNEAFEASRPLIRRKRDGHWVH